MDLTAALSPPARRPRLSVVAPCYNEAESLDELYRRVTAACTAVVKDDYEIVLVNDGSRDATWTIMNRLVKQDPHVTAVNLSRNHGHQLALSAGLTICRGARILIIDADLQDPPELLGQMMDMMDQGADVVYGQRSDRRGETWFKRSSAAVFYRVLRKMVSVDIPLDAGDFRLMSRRALDVLNSMPERSRFVRGMISWIGMKQVPIAYKRDPRFAGETKYPFSKMVMFAIDAITGFSVIPMRLASYVGMILGVASILAMAYVFISWISGEVVQGWTSLMFIVLVIGSVQLMSFWIFGEYLGRLYMESKQRPMFIIDEVIRSDNKDV
jgi:dolichol-phosphate mannosyltransferase